MSTFGYKARLVLAALGVCLAALTVVELRAQANRLPSARLFAAPLLEMPAAVDSSIPMTWELVDGKWTLFALVSWGGVSSLLAGPQLDRLQRVDSISIVPHPGHGVWMESIIPDENGRWYGFYHHEVPATICGRSDRSILNIGAVRSIDHGLTWENLGIILEAPRNSQACASSNRFLLGGVGDPSVMLDRDRRDLYVFFSQYSKEPSVQGVAVARMPWADRDAPAGRLTVLQDGVWLPPRRADSDLASEWEYPPGTPLTAGSNPWHDGDSAVDEFWGASIHWNSYLERYVMLLNRARNENFDNDGIYVSYSADLARGWSAPRKLLDGGGWFPQVVGIETAEGTDKVAGKRARFFLTGRSVLYIEFER